MPMGVNKDYNIISFAALARDGNRSTLVLILISSKARQYNRSIRVDRLDTQTTSLKWPACYMYRIQHRIIKPVLITEEGGEKTYVLSFDGYGCVYTQRHTHAKSQKHACHLPAGIKLALSCTVIYTPSAYRCSNYKLNINMQAGC